MKIFFRIIVVSVITLISFCYQNIYAKNLYHNPNPICTDNSRQCVHDTVLLYLNAIKNHDADNVPLADNVNRWENGVQTANNANDLRNSIKNDVGIKAVTDLRDVSWLIDGNEAMTTYLLDIVYPMTKIHMSTTRIASRFKLNNGLIEEVEVVFCNSPNKNPEERKIDPKKGPRAFICTRNLV